jgi:phage-related protein
VLKTFPSKVQDELGYALYLAQAGGNHHGAKPLHGLGSGVMEVGARDRSGAYRAVYTVSFQDAIYVVHAFHKKSKSGIATPLTEIDLVRRRLGQLRNEAKDAKK